MLLDAAVRRYWPGRTMSCFRTGWLLVLIVPIVTPVTTAAQDAAAPRFVDLSLLVAPEYPCTWPDGFPRFRLHPEATIGRDSAYHIETLTIDGNTGTQLDVPPHSVARPELNLPNSGPLGHEFTDRTPAWKFVGEACVVDIRELLDVAPPGESSLVRPKHLQAWEEAHRRLRAGDAVLLRSGYSDMYYQPLPAGRQFIADALEKKKPGWPDPHPDAMEYLVGRQVMHIGTDSPSMGPIPDLAEPTHYAALKAGAVFTEGATGLAQLPVTGAFYCMMGPKHKDGPYSEGRAFAIVGEPLASRLIESARARRVADLSVVMSIDHPVTWPGDGVDRHRHRYTKADFLFSENLQLYHHTHIMDSHAGTHLVPPSFALPAERLDPAAYAPEVRIWLEEYERQYGARGVSDVTTEKVPLSQTCGEARVIDVRQLAGTTSPADWPASPEIGVDRIQAYESKSGALNPGDVVIFLTAHSDRYYRPGLDGRACLADPINGKSEGWPAPGPAAIRYLAERGIRCVATDGPTLGGVDPQRALMTYWALGTQGMVGVEFLTNVGALPEKSYFLFAPVKIHGCHGGPGRAIALY
jgi:kynurenine formamidase